jgi:hypothetical protein
VISLLEMVLVVKVSMVINLMMKTLLPNMEVEVLYLWLIQDQEQMDHNSLFALKKLHG